MRLHARLSNQVINMRFKRVLLSILAATLSVVAFAASPATVHASNVNSLDCRSGYWLVSSPVGWAQAGSPGNNGAVRIQMNCTQQSNGQYQILEWVQLYDTATFIDWFTGELYLAEPGQNPSWRSGIPGNNNNVAYLGSNGPTFCGPNNNVRCTYYADYTFGWNNIPAGSGFGFQDTDTAGNRTLIQVQGNTQAPVPIDSNWCDYNTC